MYRGIILVILGLMITRPFFLKAQGSVQSWQDEKIIIAIVNFKNTSADEDLDYLEETIAEAISTTLAAGSRLEIVERGLLEEALKEIEMSMIGIVDEKTAAEVGRAVGANAVLVGSFVSIGRIIRINTRLVDVQTGKVIKAGNVQGSVGEEIFHLMDQVALSMEQELTGRVAEALPPPEEAAVPPPAEVPRLSQRETRSIRLRKLAQNWRGEKVLLTFVEGKRVTGVFVKIDSINYTLERRNKQVVFPIDEVTAVTIKPGLSEAVLALLAGALGGGLGTSFVVLTVPGAGVEVQASAAGAGAAVGLWWGYKTFYQEVKIELQE